MIILRKWGGVSVNSPCCSRETLRGNKLAILWFDLLGRVLNDAPCRETLLGKPHETCHYHTLSVMQASCLEGLVTLVSLDGPNKLDARGVPGLGLVISSLTLHLLCSGFSFRSSFASYRLSHVKFRLWRRAGLDRYTVCSESWYGLLGVW